MSMRPFMLVAIAVLAFALAPIAVAQCIVPFTGMSLSSSRMLCQGEYDVENIVVEGSGVVIECDGTILKGSGENAGISVEYAQDITIRGCALQNYEVGISVKGSENVVLENNLLLGYKFGIFEQGSSTTLKNNTFEDLEGEDFKSLGSIPEEEVQSPEQSFEDLSHAIILRKQVVLKNPGANTGEIEQQVEELLQQADLSQELFDIQRTVAIDKEAKTTTVTLSITPKQPLKDVAIYEGIPKCLSEYLSQVVFSNNEFEIIEEDPLIMWTFSHINEKSKLSYIVGKAVSKECTDLLVGFGIASPSMALVKKEKPVPKETKGSSIAFGVLVLLFGAIILHRMASKASHKKRR